MGISKTQKVERAAHSVAFPTSFDCIKLPIGKNVYIETEDSGPGLFMKQSIPGTCHKEVFVACQIDDKPHYIRMRCFAQIGQMSYKEVAERIMGKTFHFSEIPQNNVPHLSLWAIAKISGIARFQPFSDEFFEAVRKFVPDKQSWLDAWKAWYKYCSEEDIPIL
jgi:hypothetical protein